MRSFMIPSLAAVFAAGLAAPAFAQAGKCPSPVYEKRFVEGIVKLDPPSKPGLSKQKIEDYAKCQARLICANNLNKSEFEMYVLDTLNAVGDGKSEIEVDQRFRKELPAHQAAMRKVKSPNDIRAACLKEVAG